MQEQGTAQYLRVKAVAKRFDVSPSTIYRAIKSGRLDSVTIGGTVRIPAAAIRGFVAGTASPGEVA